jgi:two-component system nitrogen regulation response regulator GlnG
MPAGLQTRLLRVLSEGRFYRVGGRKEVQVDVRIIAATNQNLESLVEQGKFRNDLFHRLNVLSIQVPPLRERTDDIVLLLDYYLNKYSFESEVKTKSIRPEAMEMLQKYPWPGNVRELQNLVQQLIILNPGETVGLSDLPDYVLSGFVEKADNSWQHGLRRNIERRLRLGETGIAKELSEEFERILIELALTHSQGHKQKAAKVLGWGRNTLSRKLTK